MLKLTKARFILPNLFTLGSIFFGVVAILSSASGQFKKAAIAIIVAAVADSLDGRVARLTRAASRFGVELDSLADLVSFGVAPAVLCHAFATHRLGYWASILLAFGYVGAGALRLARFNVESSGHKRAAGHFTGLPIPGAAGLVATFVWSAVDMHVPINVTMLALTMMCTIVSVLMVSNVKYPSFKKTSVSAWTTLSVVSMTAGLIWLALRTKASLVLFSLAMAYASSGPLWGAAVWVKKTLPTRLHQPSDAPQKPHD